jgi:manganese transport protein
MLALVATIGVCSFIELVLIKPYWPDVFSGFTPSLSAISDAAPLYLAIGILGATVMPHNLYLHSSIVQTRLIGKDLASKQDAVKLARIDTIGSLALALLVNAAILILAAAAFHNTGHSDVVDIQDAYHLLDPLVGGAFASILFGVALLASGQSSTFTGTIAGQVIMEGYLDLRIPCWQRRLITRGLALIPAFMGVWLMGDAPSASCWSSARCAQPAVAVCAVPADPHDRRQATDGAIRQPAAYAVLAWFLFALISGANAWLIGQWCFDQGV